MRERTSFIVLAMNIDYRFYLLLELSFASLAVSSHVMFTAKLGVSDKVFYVFCVVFVAAPTTTSNLEKKIENWRVLGLMDLEKW